MRIGKSNGIAAANFGPDATGKVFMGRSAIPLATVTAYVDGVAQSGPVTADALGLFTYAFTAKPSSKKVISFRAAGVIDVAGYTMPIELVSLTMAVTAFPLGLAAGSVIGALSGKTAGSTILISPNDGRIAFDEVRGAIVVGSTASQVGSINYTLYELLDGAIGSPRASTVTITVQSGTITLSMLNQQPQDGMSVESWRGRHLAMIETNLSNAVITVSDGLNEFTTQGKAGEPHLLQFWGLQAGAIGTKRPVTITARSASQSISRTIDIETKHFTMDPKRYLAFFDYTDAATMTLDGTGRVIKVVDKLNGHIREHSGGYADLAPGTNAPVFDAATKRLKFTRASGQYLRAAPDAVNDDWRALTGPMNAKFSHIIIGIPSSLSANQHMVSYADASGNVKTALRWQPGTPNILAVLRQSGSSTGTPQSPGGGVSESTPDLFAANKPFIASMACGGEKIWTALHDRRVSDPANNISTAATITQCDLGRFSSAISQGFDGVILAEIIVKDDVCPSELRGIWDSFRARRPEQSIQAIPELREALDFSQIGPARFNTDETGWDMSPDYQTDMSRPGTWSYGHVGDNLIGTGAANDTEVAFHLSDRHPATIAAGLKLQEVKAGNVLSMKAVPIATSGLSTEVKTLVTGLKSSSKYTHFGSYRHTRNFATITYGMTEVVGQNPESISGNFACMSWDLHDGDGHPPETDDNEQPGALNGLSIGVHANPRWPLLGTRMARSYVGMVRSSTDKEAHSYQVVKDAERDLWKYYQDGYLAWSQEAQKGLKIDSLKAWKAALIDGSINRGSGLVAQNGTGTGQLRVSLNNANQRSPATFTAVISGGQMVDFSWDNQLAPAAPVTSAGFTPGMYNDDAALTLKKADGTAITATTLPDTSLVHVGVNDPVFFDGFHCPMYKIVNNALGGFTGAVPADRVSEMKVSNMRLHPMKRAETVVTTAIQNAANTHCTNLFAAMASRGINPDDTDRAIIANLVSQAMATVRRWDRPMDGSDETWDRTNARSIWDGIAQLGIFIGPYGLLDWKDPATAFTVSGAPVRTADLGYVFTGQAGGGQFVDTAKALSSVKNLYRDDDNGFSLILTGNNTAAADPMRPIAGAGSTVLLGLAGENNVRVVAAKDVNQTVSFNFANRFDLRQSMNLGAVEASARTAMTPGFYSMTRHEHRTAVWKSGRIKAPFYASYYANRNFTTGHAGGVTPSESFKIGSNATNVQGAAGSVGGFVTHRWWNDEEHAAFYALLKPLLLRYGVPGHTA